MSQNKFSLFMDKLMDRPLMGFPLRIIFTEKWHIINAGLFFIGLVVLGDAKIFAIAELKLLGLVVIAPPLFCFTLLPVLAITFVILETRFSE